LRALFERSGLSLSKKQLEQFWDFHCLLRERNDALDLTRLRGFDSMVIKLYVDSALVARLIDVPSPLLDLGSGGGFPGIPLKIVRPDVHVVLAEPRKKRVAFLQEAIEKLGLRDIEVRSGRIGRTFEGEAAAVITRAVESIPDTLDRVSPWLQPGGRVVFMKGPDSAAEVATLRRDYSTRFKINVDRSYDIPHTSQKRRLVVVERADAELEAEQPAAEQPAAARLEPGLQARFARKIESESNPRFKHLMSLHKPRGIRKSGRALVGGMRPILEIVAAHPARCVTWITSGPPAPPPEVPQTVEWYQLAARLFREVDVFGTGPPLLEVRVPDLEAWSDDDWPRGCTLFVPFQDPENVGALLRSAAAFDVARVVLLAEAANPFHPRSLRAAGGSPLLKLPMQRGPAIEALRVEGAPLVALSTSGDDVGGFDFPHTFGLLPGLEGPGLPDSLPRAATLGIPMAAGVESLNAASATAIALYLWRRQVGGAP
jgi:16S rRNA (guanine527-N7)-methyltransferase